MTDTILNGKYAIMKQIGSGGMSNVYCALNMKTNEVVSIKMLKPDLFKNKQAREMFRKEAEIAIKLKHKNTITAYEIVEELDKMYIVLQYIEGMNLKDYIRLNGPLKQKEAIHIVMQIARALRYAHNSGFIHKDVKPQNIILDREGNAFLTDFGLAGDDEYHITATMVLGSVYYLSPEHAKGGEVTERSDIYSLGIVLYEMLTGHPPFEGEDTKEVLNKQLYADATPPHQENSNISIAISEVVMKAINKDPEYRYVNFNNLIADVRKAEKNPDKSFVQFQAVPLARKDADVFKWKKVFVGIAVILAVFAALFFISNIFKKNSPSKGMKMPDLKNMTQAEATKKLDDLGIKYTIEYYDDEDKKNGTVVHHTPFAGSNIEETDTAVIGVVLNSQNTNLPSLTNMKKEDAIAYLESLNISKWKVEYVSSDLPKDFVVSQQPEIGSALSKVNQVTIYLSNNQVEHTVPNIVGLSLDKAIERLNSSGYRLGIVTEDNSRNDVKVFYQTPESGEKTTNVLMVDVTVGKDPNKNVRFNFNHDVSVKEDGTNIKICYEEDDGILYFVKEFKNLKKGITNINTDFYAFTNKPKTVYIYVDGVRRNIIENVEAAK